MLNFSVGIVFAQQDGEAVDTFIITLNGKKGFIDRSGKIVIEPRFDQVQDFSGGIARVWMHCRPCTRRFIDKSGVFVRSSILDEGPQINFSEGLAAVSVGVGPASREGFIDNTGELVIEPQFLSATEFSEGLAAVRAENRKRGYIDHSGKFVIAPTFENAWEFHEGLARIGVSDKWGFIDKAGKIVIAPQYDEVSDFYEGLAMIRVGRLRGYIDRTGKVVIKPQFEDCYEFSEGMAYVKIGEKYGFIDKAGSLKIEAKYDRVLSFSDGLAVVKIDGKFEFIDKEGRIAIPIKFDSAKSFRGGLAEVSLGKSTFSGILTAENIRKIKTNVKSGYIDKTGKFIWVNK